MSDIKRSLENLADALSRIENKPAPRAEIKDRELSGNKIHGGKITRFASTGIVDESGVPVLAVKNDGIHVAAAHIDTIESDITVQKDLEVKGVLTASRLCVDEISANIKHEKTTPLEFRGEDSPAYNKGLIWTSSKTTKQFVLHSNPDRLFSSESIDLHRDQSYMIDRSVVLSKTSLGNDILDSNLKKLGTLRQLNVSGNVDIDGIVKYHADTEQLSIGCDDPKGILSLESLDHQFVIDADVKDWKMGTWTTADLHIITDDTPRISISQAGTTTVHSKSVFQESVGIKSKNPLPDVDLTVAGAVRFQNKKQEVRDSIPQDGAYSKGDIVWNNDPKPNSYIGWVCVREGTPGVWSPFGQIVN